MPKGFRTFNKNKNRQKSNYGIIDKKKQSEHGLEQAINGWLDKEIIEACKKLIKKRKQESEE